MKLLLIFITCICLIVTSSVAYADWSLVGKSRIAGKAHFNFFTDFSRIRKIDDKIYYWQLQNRPKKWTDRGDVNSLKYYNKGDCLEFKYEVLQRTLHVDLWGEGGEGAYKLTGAKFSRRKLIKCSLQS